MLVDKLDKNLFDPMIVTLHHNPKCTRIKADKAMLPGEVGMVLKNVIAPLWDKKD